MSEAGHEEQNVNDSRAPRPAPRGPQLRVRALADALAPNELAKLGTAELAEFLLSKRWFGAKAVRPSSARVRDVIALPFEGGRFAIARLEVATEGGTKTYQLPLCVRGNEELGDRKPKSVLATVVTDEEEGLLFDAVEDGAFLRALADAIGRGGEFGSGRSQWVIETLSAAPLVVPASAAIRVGSVEQSNTSVILGQEAILKLFRRLETGPNPDVELTHFLTIDAEFPHTPSLLGIIRFDDDGTPTIAGMLQEYLAKSVDAWAYALSCARPYFQSPKDREIANPFLGHAERLGVVTRALHDALAKGTGPDLAPEPAKPALVEQWGARAKAWVRDGLALLDKQRTPEAEALAKRGDRYLGVVDEILNSVRGDAGLAIRIHGDYHLGQVLRTASDDFMIIDFEGEPARSLAERREKASPLRDVAGMLRSFAYASATLGMEAKSLDVGTRELRIGRWERDTRDAFMRGYLGADEKARGILPSDPAHTYALLKLFETEKAFYELAYELNNRPDWAWIPMRGIAKLLTVDGGRSTGDGQP
jgi:maltose alpha-D-glucosyltransferase/alpha-amylase